ncbi:MAG: NAD(P)-dependent oxidoreductase [Cyanobacteria bacterium J06636_16]
MKRIAVLGTGAMGSRVARNLLKANYPVIVYNRTVARAQFLLALGATYAATPREAAEQADVVISMVTQDEASRAVWLAPGVGAVAGLDKNTIAIESSTLTVDWTKELGAAITTRGAAFLDAPVVGSRPQAEASKLIYLVGGKPEALIQVEACLQASGTVYPVGAVGEGMTMKLAVNALFGIQVAALAEILGMLNGQGIALDKALSCLNELPIMSPAARGAAGLMMQNNHSPLFPIELVTKDFRYAVQTVPRGEVVMPATAAIREVYQTAIAQGYGSDNMTAVMRLFLD